MTELSPVEDAEVLGVVSVSQLAELIGFAGAQEILDAWCSGMAPDPNETVWEWADRCVILPAISAAEAGRYDSGRTPYLREILTNLSVMSPVMSTILMKGSQIGASQAGLAFVLYIIAVGGGPAIVVCPTIAMAELYSKQRLDPLIAECEEARAKVPLNKGKNSGNTLRLKTFPGGMVRLTGGNSANALKSMPAKWAIYEEPDEFPKDLEGQGNAVDMVRRRLTTYGRRAKEFANCTPSLKSESIIWALFQTGDQREYRMPCPHGCGHMTVFNKEMFRFEPGKPETAHMVCENVACGKRIEEPLHKESMLLAGEWIPLVKDAPPGTPRSYYLPAFYSPVGWEPWANIARMTEEAEGNYEKTKTLWNQVYGLPWNDVTDRPSHDILLDRASRSGYRTRQIPAEVLFLTAGVDIGQDHIEISVWGFGRRGRRFLIEHVRIRGSYTSEETWDQAERFLRRRYAHPLGAVLEIRRAAVDRGKWPNVVIPWVRKQDPSFIVATRGSPVLDHPILKEGFWLEKTEDGRFTREGGFLYWHLGVGLMKLELYGHLNKPEAAPGEDQPAGWVSLPQDVEPGWVEQLVSEEYVTVETKGGRPKSVWRRIGGLRAEALDCANYARAMAELMGWSHWTDVDFEHEEARLAKAAEDLRMAMSRLESERIAAGDRRPVRVEDIVPNIVSPDTLTFETQPVVPRVIPGAAPDRDAGQDPIVAPAPVVEGIARRKVVRPENARTVTGTEGDGLRSSWFGKADAKEPEAVPGVVSGRRDLSDLFKMD